MQPPFGFNREVRRSLVPWALVASALAVAAALAGAEGASGQNSPIPMQPFPIVRIAGEVSSSGATVTRLSVTGPAASRLVTRCTPSSKCPYEQRTRLIPGPEDGSSTVRIGDLERRYRAGATVRVFVVMPGFIGKYTSVRIRRGRQPKRYDRCLLGLALTPISCPSSVS